MLSFNNDFIGEIPNTATKFSGSDTEELFVKNLKQMPSNWYYRDREIVYKNNEFGHRSLDTKDIDFEDYFLVAGCSHTYGTGLELEKTYPYLVSHMLEKPYYNLAVGASGIDTMFYNLNIWLNKFSKPKFIILQWPEMTRFLLKNNLNDDEIEAIGSWHLTNSDIKNFYSAALYINYFETKLLIFYKLILTLCKDIPLINISFNKNDFVHNQIKNIIQFKHEDYDFARDNVHLGIQNQEKIANAIVDKYQEIKL